VAYALNWVHFKFSSGEIIAYGPIIFVKFVRKSIMSTAELKQILISKIQSSDDINLIKEAIRLFEIDHYEEPIYMVSESEREAINEARQEIANGEYFTDEQANRLIEAGLKK
jgi:hypothetical protein